jgi:hypothetical protein
MSIFGPICTKTLNFTPDLGDSSTHGMNFAHQFGTLTLEFFQHVSLFLRVK